MKKALLLLVLSFLVQGLFAQSGQTTVYLRNGSVVKGKLTTSGERMKVQTPNGSVVYFTQKAVKEIVEAGDENRQTSNSRSSNTDDRFSRFEDYSDDSNSNTSSRNSRSTTYRVQPKSYYDILGYRGFVDIGYTFGVGDYGYNRFDVSTSHGCQFNPYVFLGAGIGLQFYKEDLLNWGSLAKATFKMTAIPIFADFRANFTESGPIIPFAGLKVGYTIGMAKMTAESFGVKTSESETKGLGAYIVPSIGAKYMVSPSVGINLSVGYTMQFATYELVPILEEETKILGGITIKAGIEF